ncbi:hypothetical protein ONS95_007171 [Cadophora gregata]|uniref:uncharacterized protein n=1 Tax=Cadophora gregata TaxID=51156 RepID=UPI0026DB1CE1|nr:uncharacterized protein ONS95_007171 [Cadophora gregata]KAK0100720.1 hypothetical protein ONS95_007171 [Cadophora gregata]KAK0117283.1 hypothetical protein ONS96_013116 [Cadophora gregata f. sp. sojae]
MPFHFDISWAGHLTDTVTSALLLPLVYLLEFLTEDLPRVGIYVVKIYFQCASIIFSTTIYCSRLLLASFVQYIAITLVWIQMSLRLSLIASTIYILGRFLQILCEFFIKNPVYTVLAAMGILILRELFRYLVPILTWAQLVDRGIQAMIFKMKSMAAKKKMNRKFVVVRRSQMIDEGTQTVKAWDRVKEKVKLKEIQRPDGHPNKSDEDWETDSEDEHEEIPGRRMV